MNPVEADGRALQIRSLVQDDIPAAMELVEQADWNQTPRDWERFLDFAPDGCLAGELDGRLVATTVAARFPDDIAWIAMVLVDVNHRRRGFGTEMLRAGLSRLDAAGVRCIRLDATPLGRPVYQQLGFVDEHPLQRREGVGMAVPADATRKLTDGDWDGIAELDRLAFGAERIALLRSIHEAAPELSRVVEAEDRIGGYSLVRPGRRTYHIAPCVALTAAAAAGLFAWTMKALRGQRICFDLPDRNPAAVSLADRCGFGVQRAFTRMVRGVPLCPGNPEFVYATSGPELG